MAPVRLSLGFFPQNYEGYDSEQVARIVMDFLYIAGLVWQIFFLVMVLYRYAKEFVRTKSLDIAWYDWVDIFAISLCVTSVIQWFIFMFLST